MEGKSLVDINKGQVLIIILNSSEKEVQLHSGTIAAMGQPVYSMAAEADTDQWVRNISVSRKQIGREGMKQESRWEDNTEQEHIREIKNKIDSMKRCQII